MVTSTFSLYRFSVKEVEKTTAYILRGCVTIATVYVALCTISRLCEYRLDFMHIVNTAKCPWK